MPSPNGIFQTQSPSTKVTIEPIKTASHADMRKPANRNSKRTTGMSATNQVRNRFPVGSRICVNMDESSRQKARRIVAQTTESPNPNNFYLLHLLSKVSSVRCSMATFSDAEVAPTEYLDSAESERLRLSAARLLDRTFTSKRQRLITNATVKNMPSLRRE